MNKKWELTPKESRPAQYSMVEVITYEGKQVIGKFLVDDNWQIPGYPHDLFNRDIVAWRLTDNK